MRQLCWQEQHHFQTRICLWELFQSEEKTTSVVVISNQLDCFSAWLYLCERLIDYAFCLMIAHRFEGQLCKLTVKDWTSSFGAYFFYKRFEHTYTMLRFVILKTILAELSCKPLYVFYRIVLGQLVNGESCMRVDFLEMSLVLMRSWLDQGT